MARPRSFVNREGRKVKQHTGVSFHRASNRFYTVGPGGERAYFRSWDDARASLAIAAVSSGPAVSFEIVDDDIFGGPPSDELPPEGTPLEEIDDNHPHKQWMIDRELGIEPTQLVTIPAAEFWTEAKWQLESDPEGFVERLGLRRFFDPKVVQKGECPRLRAVGVAWKQNQIEKHGSETRHITEQIHRWERFAKSTGNCKVDVLEPKHFRSYFEAIASAAKGKSAKWYLDRCNVPKSILKWAKKKFPEYGITSDMIDWSDSYDRKVYRPARSNRMPITAEQFAKLIATAKEWQQFDVNSIDVSTNRGRGLKRQAHVRDRNGYLLEAVIRIATNCALDCVDLERLQWSNVKFNADIPHLDFPRKKMEARVGQPTPRITPLLSRTIESLRNWKAFEEHSDGRVFRNSAGGTYDRSRSSRAFRRLKAEAELSGTLTLKSLRNAAPTIAYKQLHSRELADLILGHEVNGVVKHYIGDIDDPKLLLPLVKLVGETYKA